MIFVYMAILLGDCYYYIVFFCGSDCGVGSLSASCRDYTSGGANVISVVVGDCLVFMYILSVFYNDATSFYKEIMVATSFVWFSVWGGSSILSIQLALYFAFSIL